MNLNDAIKRRNEIEGQLKNSPLKKFPKGPMGLTPDSIKSTPEWKAAKQQSDKAFQELRALNAWIAKARNLPR